MATSLRGRLGITYALIAAGMLAGAYLVAVATVDAALVQSAAERLEIEAGLVVADSAGGRGATATDLAAGDLAIVLGGYGTAVAILDGAGQVLAAEPNGADPTVLDARLSGPEYAAVVASRQTARAVRAAPDGGRTLIVAAPVQLRTGGPPGNSGNCNGQGQGQGRGLGNQKNCPSPGPAVGPANAVAQLAISLDGVDASVAGVRSTLQAAALGLLLAAAAAVWLITAIGLRPLQRISTAAGRIAAGDMSARAALPDGRDEVGRLGQAFDDMADRVDSTLQAQRAFAADASHELRSPLTVLGGYIDVLTRTEVDPATRTRMLASMRGEVDRLSRLSTDLLLLTQLEAGGGRLQPAPVDLGSLVEEVGEAARMIGSERRISVNADASMPVVVDQDRLTQAVMNLVDNAIRHTPPDGEIRISARREGAWAFVNVTNTGPAIAPEDLSRVFERYFRAGRGAGADGHHAGLGLAIVKAIVEASGGSVGVESSAAGTTFAIGLPISESETPTAGLPARSMSLLVGKEGVEPSRPSRGTGS